MDVTTLRKYQYEAVRRLYELIDEAALMSDSTDLKYVSGEIRRLRRAIEAELEGMEEAVKEFHNI